MTDVTLREYRQGDWDAMHALDVLCFLPPFRFSRRAMRAFAEAAGAITLLAESNGELTGFCTVQMDEQVGYVVTLDVATAWRRHGLARRLMAEIEKLVRTAGGIGMALHVYTGNMGAVRFYQAMGYVCVGLARSFYGCELDALVYEKKF